MVFDWTPYLATGIKVPSGAPIPPRKEIRDLTAEEQWLYVQGLSKFQQSDSTDPMSYYQIAGIHGAPYTTWPNKAENTDIKQYRTSGFCTHSSILFLTWHRPYLALFESALCTHIKAVADGIDSKAPNKDAYIKAANSFRMPYWDWARKGQSPIFPQAALDEKVNVKGPAFTVKGFSGATENPLWRYKFPEGAPRLITLGKDEVSPGNDVTVRYPGPGDGPAKLKDSVEAFYNLKVPGVQPRNLPERIGYIMRSYAKFGPMSFNALPAGPNAPATAGAEKWGSMEDVHNSLHDCCGGGGHMSNPTYAAFDPIFWLHHTNIDRLFAIWQVMHQDTTAESWVTPTPISRWGFAEKDRIIFKDGSSKEGEQATTPLYPFKDSSGWIDSNKSVKTEKFGYTYPETAGMSIPGEQADRNTLRAKLNTIYPDPPTEIRRSFRKVDTAGQGLLPQATMLKQISTEKVTANHTEFAALNEKLPDQQTLLTRSLEPGKPVLRDLAPDRKYLEWLINVKAEKHALGGSYSVAFFLGPVQEDAIALWPLSPHYVGSFSPFGQDTDTQCGKCKEDQADHLQITGQIPLTLALMERYLAQMLPDLTVDTVVPYLRENLHWRVQVGGTVLDDRSQLAGLTVFVVSNEVTLPEDENEPPVYAYDVTIHPEVTTNRDGDGRGEGTGLAVGQQ